MQAKPRNQFPQRPRKRRRRKLRRRNWKWWTRKRQKPRPPRKRDRVLLSGTAREKPARRATAKASTTRALTVAGICNKMLKNENNGEVEIWLFCAWEKICSLPQTRQPYPRSGAQEISESRYHPHRPRTAESGSQRYYPFYP